MVVCEDVNLGARVMGDDLDVVTAMGEEEEEEEMLY